MNGIKISIVVGIVMSTALYSSKVQAGIMSNIEIRQASDLEYERIMPSVRLHKTKTADGTRLSHQFRNF